MTEREIVDQLVEVLSKYSHIKFERRHDNELEIFCNDKNGFDILLQTDQRENTLSFGTLHWHFDNTEERTNEMFDQLIFCLTGIARVKEFSKNGIAYKWTLQFQDNEGNWLDSGTMGRINFNFWTKYEVRYLSNELLPKEKLYSDNEK